MGIQQSRKQSDLEKRLKLLRQQTYGNQKSLTYKSSDISNSTSKGIVADDIAYLSQDLSKITLLASLAIGTQIILFYLLQSHILKFNLF